MQKLFGKADHLKHDDYDDLQKNFLEKRGTPYRHDDYGDFKKNFSENTTTSNDQKHDDYDDYDDFA